MVAEGEPSIQNTWKVLRHKDVSLNKSGKNHDLQKKRLYAPAPPSFPPIFTLVQRYIFTSFQVFWMPGPPSAPIGSSHYPLITTKYSSDIGVSRGNHSKRQGRSNTPESVECEDSSVLSVMIGGMCPGLGGFREEPQLAKTELDKYWRIMETKQHHPISSSSCKSK